VHLTIIDIKKPTWVPKVGFLKQLFPKRLLHFHLTIPYIKYNTKTDVYELKIQVNDLKPIERFVRGIEHFGII
jgi:hypothetical protein